MMRISQPLAEQVFEAYCELFGAVEDGIEGDRFFELRECFRNLQARVQDDAVRQDELNSFRAFAKDEHNDDGHLEIENSAIVSVSEDGGAYVEAWIWVPDEALVCVEEGKGDTEGCKQGLPSQSS